MQKDLLDTQHAFASSSAEVAVSLVVGAGIAHAVLTLDGHALCVWFGHRAKRCWHCRKGRAT
jgi:hypothetical protein